MRQITDVVKHLIIINVIVWLAVEMLPGILPDLKMFFPASAEFRPFQIVTHMFDHDHRGVMHIAFNMMTLFFLGPTVENELGQQRFLILYLLSGLGAALAYTAVDYISYQQLMATLPNDLIEKITNEGRQVILGGQQYIEASSAQLNSILNIPVVGASGAISGIVVAFAVLFPNRKLMMMFIPVAIPAKYFVLIFLGLDLFLGLGRYKTGIAHFAHLGGALTGFLIVYFIFKRTFNR